MPGRKGFTRTALPVREPERGQKPYMSCPGQDVAANDLFYFTLFDQPNYLDWYNSMHNGDTLPHASPITRSSSAMTR